MNTIQNRRQNNIGLFHLIISMHRSSQLISCRNTARIQLSWRVTRRVSAMELWTFHGQRTPPPPTVRHHPDREQLTSPPPPRIFTIQRHYIHAFQRPLSILPPLYNTRPISSIPRADHPTSSSIQHNGTLDIRLGRGWQQFKRPTTRCGLGMVRRPIHLLRLSAPSSPPRDRQRIHPGARLDLAACVC